MDNNLSEKSIFDHSENENLFPIENLQKLVNPTEIDKLNLINVENIDEKQSIKVDEKMENVLTVTESSKIKDENEETVEISKFAENFVDPIMKEAIAMHKSEIDDEINDEINDIPNEFSGDKKSDKSSSDDGFEHVKKEEVGEEERKEELCEERSEGDEVKRELEDVVFQEEMRLESASDDVNSGLKDEYESDEIHEDVLSSPDNLDILNIDGNEKGYIMEDDITKVEVDDVIESMLASKDSSAPYHLAAKELTNDEEVDDDEKHENDEIYEDDEKNEEEEKHEEEDYLHEGPKDFEEKPYLFEEELVEIDKKFDKLQKEHEKQEIDHEEHYKEDQKVHNETYDVSQELTEVHKVPQNLEKELHVEALLEKPHFIGSVYAEPSINSLNDDENIIKDIISKEVLHEEPHIEVSNGNKELELLNLQPITNNIVNNDINDKCMDIIRWVHPVSSAFAFSMLMFIEIGIMMDYSIISILSYSGLFLMIASFLYKVALNFRLINTQLSTKCIIAFNKEDVEHCVNATLSYVDYFYKEIKSIAYVESYIKNIKIFIILWVLTYVGQMFNLQSLIFIGSMFLFSMPVIYSKFEKKINDVLDKIRGQVNGVMNKIKRSTQCVTGSR